LCEQLECFKCCAIRPQYALAAFYEALFAADQIANFDDVCRYAIFEDLDGLGSGDGAGKKLDQVSGIEDGCRVVCFSCRFYGHGALDEVKGAGDAMLLETASDEGPGFAEVDFSVFGKD
jgi:hypothetical protein